MADPPSHLSAQHTQSQLEAARKFISGQKAKYSKPIVTELKEATIFWPAEEYHQQYLKKGGQSAAKGEIARVRCYG